MNHPNQKIKKGMSSLRPWGIAGLVALMAACGGMTDNYQQYLEGGEIFYPGKPDFIQVHPGKNRIELQWRIVSDPSIASVVVYWNNKRSSQTVPVSRTGGIDTVKVIIENLEEQTYTFEIYAMDAEGRRSVAAQAIGAAYGEKYRQSLLNRAIGSITLTEEENLKILWGPADAGTVEEEITWTDAGGNTRSVNLPVDSAGVLLDDYDLSIKNFTLCTTFKPDSLAIDTFRIAETISFQVLETTAEVNRSGFSLKNLPGDHNEANAAANSIDKIWTNEYNTTAAGFISKAGTTSNCDSNVPYPYWFTIDMGAEYNVSSLTLWQRGNANGAELYVNSNLKLFEIWGAAETDETYNPHDHGKVFDANWILLEECEIVPPSDMSTANKLLVAAPGHTYDLSVSGELKKVRYLRIKTIDNFQADAPGLAACANDGKPTKRTYINITSIKVEAVQRLVIY
jgi:hypothetical protein